MTHYDRKPESVDPPPMPDSGMSWGLPLGLAAAAIIATLIFYNATSDHAATASTRTATVTQSDPTADKGARQPPPPAQPR